ncbi:hypothetical protein [Citricoccus sp. I39-566]|uniref:hypothetical protein n=1 Tax=Citricoccus sp. I39-566 TaxID=3073268 RepID=UPI00286AF0AA|nr:hypothetical protein [Citricoccus sp. I39-566]WMY78003.1 hypothetical protein RE421_14430 [Citricoccus sp. I39-566]
MRIRTLLRTVAVLSLAVGAGLLGVSGAWALWSVSAPAETGTVQSANLVVKANGEPLLVNGTSTTVKLADPKSALTPTTPVYVTLTLSNHSDATAGLDLTATVGKAAVISATAGLARAVTVETAAGRCAAASFAPTSSATVVQNGSQTFCLRLSLPANAPGTLSGASATVTIPVHVEQVR